MAILLNSFISSTIVRSTQYANQRKIKRFDLLYENFITIKEMYETCRQEISVSPKSNTSNTLYMYGLSWYVYYWFVRCIRDISWVVNNNLWQKTCNVVCGNKCSSKYLKNLSSKICVRFCNILYVQLHITIIGLSSAIMNEFNRLCSGKTTQPIVS